MWIDLVDFAGRPMDLSAALAEVAKQYSSSPRLELMDYRREGYGFRHAVVIVDEEGRPYLASPAIEELAGQLLSEYGAARGGKPSGWDKDTWDFGSVCGFAMMFEGGPTEPTVETRLKANPTKPGETLRDREERYVLVTAKA